MLLRPRICFRLYSEVLFIANLVHQINEEITDKEVRLIGDEALTNLWKEITHEE